jgi:hypothetical protein
MGNINISRWILGGVVCAVILFIVDFVLNGVVLMQQWTDAMAALQQPPMGESVGQIVFFAILNLIVGLTAVWIYVGIRPRFGPGMQTAIYAGLATWLIGYLVPNAFFAATGLFPAYLLWTAIIVGVIQVPLATVAGAWLYQEP